MRKPLAFVFVSLLLACTSAAATASPPEIRVYESREHRQVTEGETTLAVDPDTAYAAAIDYPRWTTMFPNIQQVIVTRQVGVDARVTFVHNDGKRDNLHFRNQPAARMVWFEDTGGRAEVWAEITFLPGDLPGTTRVHSRIYADVRGIASLVVSDRKLRKLREQRVREDLSHLRTYFARSVAMIP